MVSATYSHKPLMKRDWDFHPVPISHNSRFLADPDGDFVLLHSGFLFSEPSFMQGVGRILDFGHTLSAHNYSPTPNDADFMALYSDWLAIGDDFRIVTWNVLNDRTPAGNP